jgi:hypothetical protein
MTASPIVDREWQDGGGPVVRMKQKITAVVFVLALFLPIASGLAEEPPAAPQLHDPGKCGENETKCLLDWYAEYKPALIEEFLAYRELETPIAGILDSHSDLAAATFGGELIRRKLLRTQSLEIHRCRPRPAAGIDFDELDALLSDCRVAIIELKFILVAAVGGRFAQAVNDKAGYLEPANACEKRFRLPKFTSVLRK